MSESQPSGVYGQDVPPPPGSAYGQPGPAYGQQPYGEQPNGQHQLPPRTAPDPRLPAPRCLGAQHFYLRQTGPAVAQLPLWVFGWITTFVLIGWVLLAAVGIWWIADTFLIPAAVREHNARAAAGLIR